MLTSLINNLFDLNMIKFGDYTLKSGQKSYVYIDLRTAISYPQVFRTICDLIYQKTNGLQYDYICGVPYSALTFASAIAYEYNIPMLLKRKEIKDYGTKKLIEGSFLPKQNCLIIEDTVTSGLSIIETIDPIRKSGLIVTNVINVIDREQGARANLAQQGCNLHTIITLTAVIDTLYQHEKISLTDKEKALALTIK